MQNQNGCFTPEQARHFVEAVKDHRLECLLVLAITTGLRKGELLGLRWADIHWEKQTLQVRRTVSYVALDGNPAQFLETVPKTEASQRTIRLPSFLLELLRMRRTKQLHHQLQVGNTWNKQGLVFPNAKGGYLSINTVAKNFACLLRQAGLPKIRFYDLRHSAATILLTRGVNIKVIQELLGHSNIQMTLNLYSHVLPDMQEEAVKSLELLYAQA